MNRTHRSQRGFNMVELMFVLGIVAVGLTALMTVQYRSAETTRQVSTFLSEQMQIEQAVREMYKTQLDYSTVSYNQILNAGLIPADIQWISSRGKAPWGLPWWLYAGASTPTGADFGQTLAFRITIGDMATCEFVGKQLAPRSVWMYETSKQTTLTLPPSMGARSTTTDLAAVDTACSAVFGSGVAGAQAIFNFATI